VATAYIGLGSNLGNRTGFLRRALHHLGSLPNTDLVKTSTWYKTPAMGGPPQGPFLNAVVQIRTELEPKILLRHLQEIERSLGRPLPHLRWGPRVIDLDLLTYDQLILEEPILHLPHPRLHERPFVLIPLAEVAPLWRHPLLGKSAKTLLEKLGHADYPAMP